MSTIQYNININTISSLAVHQPLIGLQKHDDI